jgi:hypothetical protein
MLKEHEKLGKPATGLRTLDSRASQVSAGSKLAGGETPVPPQIPTTERTVNAVRFASDGRVFVAEKNGRINVFDSLTDTTPTVVADLNVNVYNFWDRGLLGLAPDPNFPTNPYVYVLYTYDHELGSAAPAPRRGTRACCRIHARARPGRPPTTAW